MRTLRRFDGYSILPRVGQASDRASAGAVASGREPPRTGSIRGRGAEVPGRCDRSWARVSKNLIAVRSKESARVSAVRSRESRMRYLLRDVATILIDCGMRPEECFRLKWSTTFGMVRLRFILARVAVHAGRIPCSQRVLSILEMRRSSATFRMGLSSSHQERPYRRSHAKEAARHGAESIGCDTVRPLHVPAHLHHAMGEAHGPIYPSRPGGPHRHEHDQAVCAPQRRGCARSNGKGQDWAQKWAHSENRHC